MKVLSFPHVQSVLCNVLFFRYTIFIQGVVIIIANAWAFIEHLQTKKVTKVGRIDRFLCMQLTLYDATMSCYLIIISFKTIQYHGNYCKNDHKWRMSSLCDMSGFLFSLSSHGSMLTAALMGMTRCYNIVNTVSNMDYARWVLIANVLNFCNMFASLIPILPIPLVQDFFTMEYFFTQNPINPKATKETLDQVMSLYTNVSKSTYTNMKINQLLTELNNMTTSNFYEVTGRLGFYGATPLCIQNLFSTDPKLIIMKIAYVLVVFIVVLIVMLSYAVILLTAKKRAREANVNPTEAEKERSQFLSFKVSLVILTQILCWFPIISTTIITLLGQNIAPGIYEVIAIISLPMNSILNPLFHCSFMKSCYFFIKKIWASLTLSVIKRFGTIDVENVETGQ